MCASGEMDLFGCGPAGQCHPTPKTANRNTIGQDIQTRGDSRVSGYPGLSPKIQDLLLLHIDDWPVYMKFIIKCICQSEVRASVGGS